MQLRIRQFNTVIEHKLSEAEIVGEPPLRKIAIAAIIQNPYAGRYVEDLTPLIDASEELGRTMSSLAVEALVPFTAQSYGTAGIAGLAGEREQANGLLTKTFANPLRTAVGGGKAWISSFTKKGSPGTAIDVPLACKDALYVRSHYDGMTVAIPDAPQPDEIV